MSCFKNTFPIICLSEECKLKKLWILVGTTHLPFPEEFHCSQRYILRVAGRAVCLSSFPNQVLTMGGCNSTPEEREQKRINNQIEKQLYKDKREQSVKILLLGTGNFIGKPSKKWYFLGLSPKPVTPPPPLPEVHLGLRMSLFVLRLWSWTARRKTLNRLYPENLFGTIYILSYIP